MARQLPPSQPNPVAPIPMSTIRLHIPKPLHNPTRPPISLQWRSSILELDLLLEVINTETFPPAPDLSYAPNIIAAIRGETDAEGDRQIQQQWEFQGDLALNWWLGRALLVELYQQLAKTSPNDFLAEAPKFQVKIPRVLDMLKSNKFFSLLAYMLGLAQDPLNKSSADILEAVFGAVNWTQPDQSDSFAKELFHSYVEYAVKNYILHDRTAEEFDQERKGVPSHSLPPADDTSGSQNRRPRVVSNDFGNGIQWKRITGSLVEFKETEGFTVQLPVGYNPGRLEFRFNEPGTVLIKEHTVRGQTMEISWKALPAGQSTDSVLRGLREGNYPTCTEYAVDDDVDVVCPLSEGGEPDLSRARVVGPIATIATYQILAQQLYSSS